MFVCFSFLDCDFYFVKWIFEVCVSFWDYSFYFMKVGNLREGEALIVAKAVSPSRALPFLATPLFDVLGCDSVLAG